MRQSESGNVLFLILIAAALFAALTYAVLNTSRSGNMSQSERDGLSAGQISQYPASIRAAILRILVIGGSEDTDISFDTNIWGHTRYQHAVPQPDENKLFLPQGGNLPFQRAEPEWLDTTFKAQPNYGSWLFTGSACIPGIGTGDDNTCNSEDRQLDLIAILPYIKEGLCREINKRSGFQAPNQDPPQLIGDGWSATPEFAGIYTAGEVIIDAGGALYGVDSACFEGNGNPLAGSFHYFATLVQR